MQHHLSHDVELMWQVADMVAAHGTHEFQSDTDGVDRVVWFAGVKVYSCDGMPVRVKAAGLDVSLHRTSNEQSFASAIQGESYRQAVRLVSSTYTLAFHRGDLAALTKWADHLQEFTTVTAPVQKAA